MKKVIHVIHGLTTGGAETLVKEYCLHIDKSKFDVQVIVFDRHNESPYEDLLKSSGIRIIYLDDYIKVLKRKNLFVKVLFKFFGNTIISIGIKRILEEIKPDVIHGHLAVLDILSKCRIDKKVCLFYTVHSKPEAIWPSTWKGRKEYFAARRLVENHNMRFFAINSAMVDELNDMFNISNTVFLKNGIDFTRYEKKINKKEYREKFGIKETTFLIGHVGRFSPVKNHKKLIDVFEYITHYRDDSMLLLVGEGNLKNEIISYIELKGLKEKTVILSNRGDVPDLLRIMDAFVLPSLYEGLSIVTVEAQIAGVLCYIADTVPDDATVSNLVTKLSLNMDSASWAKRIADHHCITAKYFGIDEWNIKTVVEKLQIEYEREDCR